MVPKNDYITAKSSVLVDSKDKMEMKKKETLFPSRWEIRTHKKLSRTTCVERDGTSADHHSRCRRSTCHREKRSERERRGHPQIAVPAAGPSRHSHNAGRDREASEEGAAPAPNQGREGRGREREVPLQGRSPFAVA